MSPTTFWEEIVLHKRWLECFSGSWELSAQVFFTEKTSKVCKGLKEKKFESWSHCIRYLCACYWWNHVEDNEFGSGKYRGRRALNLSVFKKAIEKLNKFHFSEKLWALKLFLRSSYNFTYVGINLINNVFIDGFLVNSVLGVRVKVQ